MHVALSFLIPNEDDCRLQVLPMDEATLSAYLTERCEGVTIRVVDGYAVLLEGAMSGQEVIEVNKIRSQVQLAVHDQRLLCLLLLEHEGS